MEPNAAWINRESSSPWELVHSPARRPAAPQRDGLSSIKAAVIGGLSLRPMPLAAAIPGVAERSDAKSLEATKRTTSYSLRSQLSGSGSGRPINESNASGTPQSVRELKKSGTKEEHTEAGISAPDLKLYNVARAEPSPARNEVHALYTGVLASSLRLRELLEKQQSPQVSSRHGPQGAQGEPHGAIPAQQPTADAEVAGAVSVRRQGCVAPSQLAQLARALVDPADVQGDRAVLKRTPGQQPVAAYPGRVHAFQGEHDAQRRRGSWNSVFDAARPVEDVHGDVSMADLDACLATGSANMQIEVPSTEAIVPPGVRAEQPPGAYTRKLRRASKAIPTVAPAAVSPSCVAGGGVQRPLVRCNSPMVLCQAVQSAQTRANLVADDVPAARSHAAAARRSLAAGATALTPVQRPHGVSTRGQCDITPGSARVRLQLPEPRPLRGLQASPKPPASDLQCRDAAGDRRGASAGNPPSVAAHDSSLDEGVLWGGGLARGRSRSLSRLNPSNSQPGCRPSALRPELQAGADAGCVAGVASSPCTAGAAACEAALSAPGGGGREELLPEAAHGAATGFPAREHDGADPLGLPRRLDMGDKSQGATQGRSSYEETGARTPALQAVTDERVPAATVLPAPGVCPVDLAQENELATILSPTASSPGADPWLTVGQLAAQGQAAGGSSRRYRRRSKGGEGQLPIDLTVDAIDLTMDTIDLTKGVKLGTTARQVAMQAAAASSQVARGRARDHAGEVAPVAVTAVTVQQLSAGDDGDNGPPSPAGDEQQQQEPDHATVSHAASRRRVRLAEPAVQPTAENRKGGGLRSCRGRGRRHHGACVDPKKIGAVVMAGQTSTGNASMPGAATPAPAAMEVAERTGSGEESSPDIPIGKLAAAAVAAAAQVVPLPAGPEPLAPELTGPLHNPAAVAPATERICVETPLVGALLAGVGASAPAAGLSSGRLQDSDLPIGVLAAAASAAAGASAATTKSPGSSPNANESAAVSPAADTADVCRRLQRPSKKHNSQAEGASGGSNGLADAEETKGAAHSRKKRRKRKQRLLAVKDETEATSEGMGAEGCDGASAQGGEAAAISGKDCGASTPQLVAPPAQTLGQASVGPPPVPAAPSTGTGAGGVLTRHNTGDWGDNISNIWEVLPEPLSELLSRPLPQARAEGPLAAAPASGPPGGRVQLGQMWKRQRVGGGPPPATLPIGPRSGAAGRLRLLARAPEILPFGPQLPQHTHAAAGSDGEARGAPVQPVMQRLAEEPEESVAAAGRAGAYGAASPCGTDVAMADGVAGMGQQQPEGQQSSGPKREALKMRPRQVHGQVDGGSGAAAEDVDQNARAQMQQELQQRALCDGGSSVAAGTTDLAYSSDPADREDTSQAAASRVHIRSMWKRPRLAEAPRAPAGMNGPSGRRAILGSRAGPTAAAGSAAAVEDARSISEHVAAVSAAAFVNETLLVADGKCQVRLQPGGEVNGTGVHNSASTGYGLPAEHARGDDRSGGEPKLMEEDTSIKGHAPPLVSSAAANGMARGPRSDGMAGQESLHRTPPRAPRAPGGSILAASPRAAAGGSLGKPPRSPGDLRSAAMPPSPRIVPSPSPAGHRLRDPSLHPAAVAGSASLSPVQPLLSKFQSVAVPSLRSAVQLASARPSVVARPPTMPSSTQGSLGAVAPAVDPASPSAAARVRSPLALLAAVSKRDSATAVAEASFLQPLAPIRTKAPPQCVAASAAASAAPVGSTVAVIQSSVIQAVEALLSIPLLAEDGSPNCVDSTAAAVSAAASNMDADVSAQTAVPEPAMAVDIASAAPGAASGCRLEHLLDAAAHGSVAGGSSNSHAAALHSPLALLVDVAAAQGGGEEACSRRTPQGSGSADVASEAGFDYESSSRGDPPSEGLKPLRSAIRGMQRFFSVLGPWVGVGAGAKSSPVQSTKAGAAEAFMPSCAGGSSGGGAGSGNCSLLCEERLDMFAGKAASPLPPRPRPAVKPSLDASRAVPGGSKLASRLSPSKAESPMASVRPADGYSTPPCGTGRPRPTHHGPSGWPRSTSYPGHQYDSMIEDVVQQMLNEASPDGPPPLELGQPAGCPPGVSCSREVVTGVVDHPSSMLLASGDENEPLAVNGVAPATEGALAAQPPHRAPPLRRSPTGKRPRSADAEEIDTGATAAGAKDASWEGGSTQHEDEVTAGAQPQAPISGHRRRPRKAARVDGGDTASAAAAALAMVAVCDKMNLDEMSNMESDESDSGDDMLDSYSAGGVGGGMGRGAGGQARAQGPLHSGPGRGPGSMFAGRALPYGPPGGSNWMKPGLAWSRVSAGPPGQHPMGPARASPQLRGGFGPTRPSLNGAGALGAPGARPAPVGPPSCGLDPGSPGDALLDVPRTLNMPRGPGSKRLNTYLSSAPEATGARPTLEQEYREALINSRLAQAWAAGERWARCDLAGLPADLSKRGVTERLAQLESAASKLNCYRGADGASKIMAKVDEEWEHLRRIRMAAAARTTARTPTGATPSPAPGHFPAGRPPHTPLPFAAHAHAAAAAAAAAARQTNVGDAAEVAVRPGGTQQETAAAAVVLRPTDAIVPENPRSERQQSVPLSAQQHQESVMVQLDAAKRTHHGLAELVSAHAHAHCHRGSPPPPAAAPQRVHTPAQPYHVNHNHHIHNHSGDYPLHYEHHLHPSPHPVHHSSGAPHRAPAVAAAFAATSTQAQADNTPTPAALQPLASDSVAGMAQQHQNGAYVISQQGTNPVAVEGFGTPVLRGHGGPASGIAGSERPTAVTPPPCGLLSAHGSGRDAGASALRNPQQLQLTPPASILKTVPTPYTGLCSGAGAASGEAGATWSATPSGCCATGGRKVVKFAAVLELGPQPGYRHTTAPLPRPAFDMPQGHSGQEQQQDQQ